MEQKLSVRPQKIEFVKGTGKNGNPYTRLDIYFPAVDGGDPVRLSCFIRSDQKRLMGLKDE